MPKPATISIELSEPPQRAYRRDPRKQTLYVEVGHQAQMKAEGERLGRGMSWVVQQAWRIAYDEIRAMPAVHRR